MSKYEEYVRMTGWWVSNMTEFFFYQNSVQIIGQVDVDKKAELEIKKIEM